MGNEPSKAAVAAANDDDEIKVIVPEPEHVSNPNYDDETSELGYLPRFYPLIRADIGSEREASASSQLEQINSIQPAALRSIVEDFRIVLEHNVKSTCRRQDSLSKKMKYLEELSTSTLYRAAIQQHDAVARERPIRTEMVALQREVERVRSVVNECVKNMYEIEEFLRDVE